LKNKNTIKQQREKKQDPPQQIIIHFMPIAPVVPTAIDILELT
jgi:hypothetical protein